MTYNSGSLGYIYNYLLAECIGCNVPVVCNVGGRKVARRNDLLCNTVAAGVMNSDIQARPGSKLFGHLRSPEVKPVRRACAYVERRSGLLDVAYRRANLRHEPLTFDMNR